MNDRNDSQLDTLLREHLASKLDAQLGKSAERFRRSVGTVAPRMRLTDAPARTVTEPVRHWRRLGWSLGLAGAAVAAGLAVALLLPALLQQPRGGRTIDGQIARNDAERTNDRNARPGSDEDGVHLVSDDYARDVEHTVSWNTIDQGTVYLDGEIPLRSVVRQAEETVSWYDPKRNAHVQMTVPRDEVMFVGFQSQ